MPYEEDKVAWQPKDASVPSIDAETGHPYWIKHIKNGHWSQVLRRIRNEYVGKKEDQEELDKIIQFIEELN